MNIARLAGLTLILILGPGSLVLSAQATAPPADCELSNVPYLTGIVSLGLGKSRVVNETMSCLLKLWPQLRVGAGDFDISNAFLVMAAENPSAFFIAMTKEPETFNQWLADLDNLSFTWADPPPCGLDEKRRELILILEHANITDRQSAILRKRLVARLSEIRCRQIN